MRLIYFVLGFSLSMLVAFTYSSPGDDGWVDTEDLAAVHLNEIDSALDALEALFTGSDANTALALAANGSNCSAGEYPLGVGADGAVESCTDATTEIGTVAAALVNAKSAATSTDNAIGRFDGTGGDVQNSGVTIDDSNNLTVPGSVTAGGSEVPTCIILRDSDDAGDSACSVLNGTFSCETDTNGVCDDAT